MMSTRSSRWCSQVLELGKFQYGRSCDNLGILQERSGFGTEKFPALVLKLFMCTYIHRNYIYISVMHIHGISNVCMSVCMHACMHACMNLCMHTCVYVHIYIYICTYIYIYMYSIYIYVPYAYMYIYKI